MINEIDSTHLPNSVCTSNLPSVGTIKKSPSLLTNAVFSIEALALYKWIASPSRAMGPPLPKIVAIPSMKVTLELSEGIGRGLHVS